MWSRILRRGQILRLVDLEGGAAVAALFYNADHLLERYNMPDTLKAQHIARLTRGNVIFSDMGRVLCSVVEDTCGWHDTITGHADAASALAKYGPGAYQELRNEFFRNTRDNFLIELGKYGLGAKDIVANVNFFVKVRADLDGNLEWVSGNSKSGSSVSLRSEMRTLVVLSNTPHPLDREKRYAPRPVALTVLDGPPVVEKSDPCRASCAENQRGFELTEDYFK
jgi:urea carboxylase-associated protein 2